MTTHPNVHAAGEGRGVLRRRRGLRRRLRHGCGPGADRGRHPRRARGRCSAPRRGRGRRPRWRSGSTWTTSWRRGRGAPQEDKSRVIDITRPLFGDARDAPRQHGRHPPPGALPDDPVGRRSRPRRPGRRLVVAAACRRAAPHRRTSVHRCRHRHHDVRRPGGAGGPPRRRRPDGRPRARPARRGVGADGRLRADAVADDGWAGPVHPAQPRRRRAGGHTPDRRARHGDRRADLPGGVRARDALRRAVPGSDTRDWPRASPAEEERCSS